MIKDIDTLNQKEQDLTTKYAISPRMKMLLDNQTITLYGVVLSEKFIEIVAKKIELDFESDSFDMFQTHLAMSFCRIARGEAFFGHQNHLLSEIEGTKAHSVARESLLEFCKQNEIEYSDGEARYLAIYLQMLTKESY